MISRDGKIVEKKAGVVTLLDPAARLRRNADSDLPGVRPEADSFEFIIDAIDTAIYVADVDGMQAAKRFIDRHGYASDASFIATLGGLVRAIPRTKVKGDWAIREAGLLEMPRTVYFPARTVTHCRRGAPHS